MNKTAAGLSLVFSSFLLPLACDRIAPGTPLPSIGPLPVLASPTRTYTITATITKTPLHTPTPALTTTCAFMPVTQWGGAGAGAGQFQGPADVAADAATNIYVLDVSNQRVQVFDSAGNYLSQWNGANSLFVPMSMAVNPALARVYILDTTATAPQQGIMRVFDLDGAPRPTWTIPLNAYGLALDAQGRVYVGTSTAVIRYDQNGFSPVYYYSQGVTGMSFNGVRGVAVDGQGNLFAANGYSVQKFNALGQYVSQWGTSGTLPSQFSGIIYVRADSSGNVFVVDNPVLGGIYYGRVQKFDTNGSLVCYYQSTPAQYQALAFDPGGELLIVDGLNNRISKFIP